jgi:NAD(P)-dependent dehydrogenase (short-subunit alcohol dehydrogenase family)
MDKLAGKIAPGSDGSADMGLATAKQFLEEGAFVVIAESRKRKLGAEVQRLRIDATAIYADGDRLAHLERFYSDITKRNGKLEVVFETGRAVSVLLPLKDKNDAVLRGNNTDLVWPTQFEARRLWCRAELILVSLRAAPHQRTFGRRRVVSAAVPHPGWLGSVPEVACDRNTLP